MTNSRAASPIVKTHLTYGESLALALRLIRAKNSDKQVEERDIYPYMPPTTRPGTAA